MAETTFASMVSNFIHDYAVKNIDKEFMRVGVGLFESEELVNSLYEIYLTLCAKGWTSVSQTRTPVGLAHAYHAGFLLPCSERIVLTGQVDLVNDALPQSAGLVAKVPSTGEWVFESIFAADKMPVGFASPVAGKVYGSTLLYGKNKIDRIDRRTIGNNVLAFDTSFVVVKNDGVIVPCVDRSFVNHGRTGMANALFCTIAAEVINAWSDRRHQWQVTTSEHVINAYQTPLILGVTAEHVKSLFYARSLPVTEGGRKRPILHWVRAHERRIAAGVDVDVRKHLRGITEFSMEGFDFKIVEPVKESLARIAA